ncbi:hypothetical protein F4808DRAFT_418502 [Astrocystis sublimbata]|nr:hypothetical protein F4808DRAFT_418502 [Astrocystis sublimbata]
MADIATEHGDLITTLRSFYILLADLGITSTEHIILPNPQTGTHSEHVFNAAAAREAGYTPDAVAVLSALPYLDTDVYDMSFELLPSTYPSTYLGDDADEGYFRDAREMLNEVQMPPTAIRLTRSEIYGTVFIYDVESKLATAWKPFDNPQDVDDYSHAPAPSPPSECLAPMTHGYRQLRYLATPKGTDFSSPLFADSGGEPPSEWSQREKTIWRASYAVWEATQKLRDFYLESGWDVNSVVQTGFDREGFMARRDEYWRRVVMPLMEAEEEVGSRAE